jgi:hypothetical protein
MSSMASDHSREPASPGLSSQVADAAERFGAFVSALDPDTLTGPDAADLYAAVSRLGRLVEGAKTLLAPRIAASGHWEAEGHRSPASLLADLEGGSTGQAQRTLVTGRRLAHLPSTEEALRRGALSGAKVAEIAGAAATDPDAEGTLLAGSEREPLRVVKERCQRVRATSARRDPVAAERRIHTERRFRSWTDAEGAFCFEGRDTAERGARLLAALDPVTDRLREDRRAAARDAAARLPKGAAPATPESEEALRADALFLLVTGRRAGRPRCGADGPADVTEATDRPEGADDRIAAAPPATVMVRVDLEALRRGHALPGELSEIDGRGPVPVPTVAGLADDAFLRLVFTEAGDIRAISHLGRTINSHLRTALAFRDRCCVVPGCRAAYRLEIDHVLPLEQGGPTTLDNLALLCRHHHRMKTYDGWVLARDGGSDEAPCWSFTPQPPFGQEPDLGADRGKDLDRPPDRGVPAHRTEPPPDDVTLFDRPPEVVPRR